MALAKSVSVELLSPIRATVRFPLSSCFLSNSEEFLLKMFGIHNRYWFLSLSTVLLLYLRKPFILLSISRHIHFESLSEACHALPNNILRKWCNVVRCPPWQVYEIDNSIHPTTSMPITQWIKKCGWRLPALTDTFYRAVHLWEEGSKYAPGQSTCVISGNYRVAPLSIEMSSNFFGRI